MKKSTLLSLLFTLLCPAYAQQPFSVKGVVRDQTGAAVIGARIRIHSANSSGSAQSSEDGSFEIPGILDTRGTLTVNAAGFETL